MRFSMITLGGLLLAGATPAMAQDEPASDAFTVSGSVTATSDYRFRGISQTGKDPAAQATVNVNHESGFYVGVWTSTIDDKDAPAVAGYGKAEIDLYGGWTKTFKNGVGLDVGLLYYLYPIEKAGFATDFFEPYVNLSYTAGPVTAKVGANYSWSGQAGLAGNDNIYVHGDVSLAVPKTPLTVLGHVGYTDGQLGILALTSNHYMDWSLGVEASYKFVKIGIQYVDTDIKGFGVKYDHAIGANAGALGYVTLSF